ncbi:hypothetical protein BC829DRAFT_488108 [Chytridium lagenaria]|nr:hypothetical protein BC829DRAFT_488108 [Chytridium lagenaria]
MGNTTSNLSGLTVVITDVYWVWVETTRVLLNMDECCCGCLTESGRENLERVVERRGWEGGFKACVEEFAEEGYTPLINNAGIGESGPCELLPLSLHKPFLPSLRRFSRSSSLRPRIINIASRVQACVPSAHRGMRMEVRQFGIKMVCVEPGFARTRLWRRSDEEDREARRAYGADEGYVEEMVGRGKDVVLSPLTMKASYVVNWIVQAVEARSPKPRYVIGFLAHFLILAYSIVPSWIMDGIVSRAMLFPGKKGIANF